jgi:DNA invertase Pin-like site-specific DNA recombinase
MQRLKPTGLSQNRKSSERSNARVSTDDRHTESQIEQLKKAGCERIYTETASGGRWEQPELQDCLKHIRKSR